MFSDCQIPSITESEKDFTPNQSGQVPLSCRICLQDGFYKDSGDDNYIAPCDCTGSIEYVHRNCINVWVRKHKKLGRKKEGQGEVSCQVCKGAIVYQISSKLKLNSCQKIKELIPKNKFPFSMLMLIWLAFLSSLAYLIYYLIQEHVENSKRELYLLFATGAAILLFFISIFLMLKFFLLGKKKGQIYVYDRKRQ